ncbi:MAG: hypothetical protein QOJ35_2920 [Solirubrobacteraceae bacterium]|jgi:hypothetical protein|nr:hypothetical protein [Solirubrobacteraceae bacterium]
MSVRLGDGRTSTIERWLGGLAGPELKPDLPLAPDASGRLPSDAGYRCPVCEARSQEAVSERDQYDDDYDYYWGNVRLPLWIALIWQVPWRQRLDIFVIGFIFGLVIAGVAVTWGLLLSRY